MVRYAPVILAALALAACGEPSATTEPALAGGAAAEAWGAVGQGAEPITPPASPSADEDARASVDQDAPLDPLDQAMADLPPIQTGPMSSGAGGPWDDELAAERQAQLNLPTADDPLWDLLRQTRVTIDERTQLFEASHPAPVRARAGRRVTVRGYMLPLEATNRTAHFLISPYTPVCYFHPPAEPNEVIEVRLSRPIEAGYHLVEVTGVLRLSNDGEKGLFFVIPEGSARVIERVVG
ncbi:DUF3299 domain-containing protein [Brevundimonas sp.]|uniref:DUF3299 domain-containing protein n=1 Tax=Brevundimonas sp. TaxID=1871086 RepID=UPI001D846ECA|nr:DUF3299 domain-containing protein [Brevundimonas sp.]MBA3999452.1 hypothetical protein [Brevundimonas sp.]